MNNQITIIDRNNQSIVVDLICYFSNYNKKYVFYSKNETVQDGLIKMYVAEENVGLTNDISQDEWNNLKKVMQGIITGNTLGIDFLTYINPVKFNEPKAIALNDANISSIRNAYREKIGSNVSEPVLNRDILSQSFGNNSESVISQEPVQISSIPNIQNNFNMESTPVNLNTNPVNDSTSVVDVPNIEPIPSIETINNEIVLPSIEPIPSQEPIQNNPINENEIALNINSIKPGGIDSGFKVSNEPNIFDNPTMPYQITEEEINNPVMPEVNNAFVSQPLSNNDIVNNVNRDTKELTNKKIELKNRKIKLFEELANVYREENELLESENEDGPLDRTASNLFNSNGTLNDNEVLN